MRRKSQKYLPAIASLIIGISLQASAQNGAFYISGGRTIELPVSTQARAFRVKPGQLETFLRQFKANATASANSQIDRVGRLEREYGIVLVRPKPDTAARDFDVSTEAIQQLNAVEDAVPTFRTEGVDLLLIDEFIIRFNDSTPEADVRRILEDELDVRVLASNDENDRYKISLEQVKVLEALNVVNRLARRPEIRYAYPNFISVYPARRPVITETSEADPTEGANSASCPVDSPGTVSSGSPNDEYFANQWALKNSGNHPIFGGVAGADISALDAWQSFPTEAQVKVAIIDVGVDMDHPDLLVQGPGADLTTSGTGDPNPSYMHNGHGTWAAGVAGARIDNDGIGVAGVMPNMAIIPIKFAYHECETCSWIVTDGSHASAINEAVNLGAKILNSSWHSPEYDELEIEIRKAVEKNRVLVFAAGNHYPLQGHAVFYPARLAASNDAVLAAGVIAVSATNQYDELKTHFAANNPSSDPDDSWGSNWGNEISIAAPGSWIYTTDNEGGFTCASGTSLSAPIVAGAAAYLISLHPGASPADIKRWLQDGADQLDPISDPSPYFGHGRLNLLGALNEAEADQPGTTRPAPPSSLQVQ